MNTELEPKQNKYRDCLKCGFRTSEMMKLFLWLLITCLATISIQAQFQDEGNLNARTTRNVQRKRENESVAESLCKIRVAGQKGFDRVVLNLIKESPNTLSNIFRQTFTQAMRATRK